MESESKALESLNIRHSSMRWELATKLGEDLASPIVDQMRVGKNALDPLCSRFRVVSVGSIRCGRLSVWFPRIQLTRMRCHDFSITSAFSEINRLTNFRWNVSYHPLGWSNVFFATAPAPIPRSFCPLGCGEEVWALDMRGHIQGLSNDEEVRDSLLSNSHSQNSWWS